jgi:acetyl esterase/lipase
MPSPEVSAILDFGRANPMPDHDRVEDRRDAADAVLGGPLAEGTTAEEAPLGNGAALWIRPDRTDGTDGPTVLYLHGGAFEVGSPAAYQAFCSSLALLLSAMVVAPDYRLAPEHPFPAAVDDVVAAYRSLLDTGRSASSVSVMGDSAGGGLVLSCLIGAQREGLPQPASAVAISAWADLTLEADSHRRCAATDPFISTAMLRRAAAHYLVDADPRDPLASPVQAPAQDLSGLAPVLLLGAANEVLGDDSVTMAGRIEAAGGEVALELCPEAFHVWPMAGPGVPESAQALRALSTFVQDRWGRS